MVRRSASVIWLMVDAARGADVFVGEAYTFDCPIKFHLDDATRALAGVANLAGAGFRDADAHHEGSSFSSGSRFFGSGFNAPTPWRR